MDVNGKLSLEEAKRVAVMGPRAEAGKILGALDTLYVSIRELENQRDAHLFAKAPAPAEAA